MIWCATEMEVGDGIDRDLCVFDLGGFRISSFNPKQEFGETPPNPAMKKAMTERVVKE